MQTKLYNHIKQVILPVVAFSAAAGFVSALFVTAFKIAAEWVVHLSASVYDAARDNPAWLALLLAGAAAIGSLSSIILAYSGSSRGGGIPTSVAAIRGIISFRWLTSLLVLPFCALLTYLCGLPLGTEGPCVQMGTAIGDGVVRSSGQAKQRGWRRYIMTGGASAGFSIATSSPITAILFSMEELHKHFSPILLTVASISVITAEITVRGLAALGIGSVGMFSIPALGALAPRSLFAPLLVGIVCGFAAIFFTRSYHLINKAVSSALKKISPKLALPIIFASLAAVGFLLSDALGSGHSLVHTLLHGRGVWYVLIAVFLVRMVGVMISNTAGVTGGIFLPTLAFGAILGSLCGEAMIALGWIGAEHSTAMVVLGITAFLGSTSRIPITACVFAVEALGGINNVLPLILATTVSLIITEASGLEDFTDTVIEAKIQAASGGNEPITVQVPLTVAPHAFAVGKELRDILWPNSCVVLSFDRALAGNAHAPIAEGDIITVCYKTHHPAETCEEFKSLVGEQAEHITAAMTPRTHP